MLHVSKRYFSFINKNIKMKYIKMKDVKMKYIKMKKIVDKFFKKNDKNGTIREALKIGQECSKKL